MPQLAQVLTDDLLTEADREPEPLPTIWTVPDALWTQIVPILAELDPPKGTGRPRIDPRAALDAIRSRLRTGVQWNQLPKAFPDDSSVHRTFQRWVAQGVFQRMWAEVLAACEELRGVDWDWQAVDGAMGKARQGGPHRPQPHRPRQAGCETQPAGRGPGGAARRRGRQREPAGLSTARRHARCLRGGAARGDGAASAAPVPGPRLRRG